MPVTAVNTHLSRGNMSPSLWVKRFVVVTALVFAVLMVAELLKGHDLEAAITFSALWSVIASAIFTGARIYRVRKGQYCAICGDAPSTGDPRAGPKAPVSSGGESAS